MNKIIKITLLSMAVGLTPCQSATLTNSQKENISIPSPDLRQGFIKGMDISMLPDLESLGAKYYQDGVEGDLVSILKKNGVNYIRARLWVKPESTAGKAFGGGNSDLQHSIELGQRAKANGMKFLLDIHYSDFWADPKKQTKPQQWQELTFENLTQQVYDYTDQVMQAHIDAGVVPDMVQVGNELNGGMLWPEGKSWGGDGNEFDRLASLLKAGIKAVKAHGQNIQVMLHLAEAGNNGLFRWWFDEISKRNVDFDIIGMSYYPWWHGSIDKVKENINDIIQRYNKPIIIVETAFPYSNKNGDSLENSFTGEGPIEGYPVSIKGQTNYLKDLMQLMNDLPNQQGLGIFYWEPAWIPVSNSTWATPAGMSYSGDEWDTGNSWENQALFDFNGNALPSLQVFKGNK